LQKKPRMTKLDIARQSTRIGTLNRRPPIPREMTITWIRPVPQPAPRKKLDPAIVRSVVVALWMLASALVGAVIARL